MILVRDKGQMCNNIIQFGHAYAWAREYGLRAVSMRFAYKYRFFNICRTDGHNVFVYLFGKLGVQAGLLHEIVYDTPGVDHSDDELCMRECRVLPVVLSGWFVRHYDLFEKYLDDIQSLFALLPEKQRVVDETFEREIPKDNITIGLHIRRGDYRTFMGGAFYLDDETYINAVLQTMNLHPESRHTIVICTNDRSLSQKRFRDALSPARVIFSQGEAWYDLGMLSRCQYVLGAPSSFSLVASMMGRNRLHWLAKEKETQCCSEERTQRSENEHVLCEDDFQPFEMRFRQFDDWFV